MVFVKRERVDLEAVGWIREMQHMCCTEWLRCLPDILALAHQVVMEHVRQKCCTCAMGLWNETLFASETTDNYLHYRKKQKDEPRFASYAVLRR